MSPDSTPPFSAVGVCGLGLIGGSIALGLRRAWPEMAVVGVDRPEVLAAALRLGAIGEARPEIAALRDVELIVLAVPVPEIVRLVGAAGRAGIAALISDVGSTKRHVMAAAEAAAVRFVGGHPIAGAARGGLENARADLFEAREWLVVPNGASGEDVSRLERLVRGLGAVTHRMEADAHDRVMAYVSHLPQLLATTLMTTAGAAVGRDGLAAAGPGFADMTRLASSPLEIWRGILATNGDYITEAVAALVAALPSGAGVLSEPGGVDELFRRANEWIAELRRPKA